MIHSATRLLRACVENNGRSTQQHGPAQDFHPFMTNLSSSVQCLRLAEAISNTSTPFLLVRGECYRAEGKAKRIEMYMGVCVWVSRRVGTRWNRKSRQAFTLEEFPVCKMCITAFLQLRRDRAKGKKAEEGKFALCVWKAFQDRFRA